MVGVIVVAIAAVICVLFNVSSITYVKNQVRRQQIAQDVDGLLQTSISYINNRISQSGGAQQFLREHCSNPPAPRKANPIISTDCFDSEFETAFGIPKSGPANTVRQRLNMILWPNETFNMNFVVTAYRAGAQPNVFVPVSTPTPLYDFGHLQVDMSITNPSPNDPNQQILVRKFTFTISI